MSAVLANVLPVFILIFLGWLIAKSGVLKAETGDALGEFVFKIAVPMLIFDTLATADFQGVSPFRLWTAYFIGVAITWAIGDFIAKRIFRRDAKIAVIAGMSGSFANNVFIGLPLVSHIVGEDGLVALSILLAIHLPIMMIVGTILMEGAAAKVDGTAARSVAAVLKQVGSNLARNPLVIALVLGLIVNISGLSMPGPLRMVIDQIAASASPAALISIGMALTRYSVKGDLNLSASAAVLKLFLLPACVFLSGRMLDLRPDWTAALVLTASVPTGINAWLIAQRFRSGQSLAASVISITTAFGVASVSFWAWLLT
ncbi:AEC family transporter [Neorhizobium sp. NCHU2750]|uniref:AEC family transporter n=1 Tax=Neorhizobium sp. NCHU2750 TaxID=1825976 RepID=UPI000E766FB4|nr:transporter [Neorhizobium sp. NCHU2750]